MIVVGAVGSHFVGLILVFTLSVLGGLGRPRPNHRCELFRRRANAQVRLRCHCGRFGPGWAVSCCLRDLPQFRIHQVVAEQSAGQHFHLLARIQIPVIQAARELGEVSQQVQDRDPLVRAVMAALEECIQGFGPARMHGIPHVFGADPHSATVAGSDRRRLADGIAPSRGLLAACLLRSVPPR